MSKDIQVGLIWAVSILLALFLLALVIIRTEDSADHRKIVHYQACQTIQEYPLRVLCLSKSG